MLIPKLIVDANVLIDYFNSDFSILKEVNRYVGQILVPDRLLVYEVPGINLQDCQQVGIKIITPKKNISKIAEKRIGQLSFIDRLIFHLAKDSKFDVITNDSDLQKICKSHNIKVKRGLR